MFLLRVHRKIKTPQTRQYIKHTRRFSRKRLIYIFKRADNLFEIISRQTVTNRTEARLVKIITIKSWRENPMGWGGEKTQNSKQELEFPQYFSRPICSTCILLEATFFSKNLEANWSYCIISLFCLFNAICSFPTPL